ncbi:hypothetical protein Hanom_Chr06g00535651 [Helianthus anomalus]
MWLVNCSKKDIECLFFNKIVYNEVDKHQAQRYQKLVNVCFAKDIVGARMSVNFVFIESCIA